MREAYYESSEVVKIYQDAGYPITKKGDNYFLRQNFLNYTFPFLYEIEINKDVLNL